MPTLKSSTYAALKSSTYATLKSSTYAALKSSTYATLKSSTFRAYPLGGTGQTAFFLHVAVSEGLGQGEVGP